MLKQKRTVLESIKSEKIKSTGSVTGFNIRETENEYMATDLKTLNGAHNYRHWLYSHIRGALGSRIIEIGSGIGNYTEMLLDHGHVWATDIEQEYVQFLSERFSTRDGFSASKLRLGMWTSEIREKILGFAPDTFVCLNVLEHIQDDLVALTEMVSCLPTDGHVVVIVPAIPWLFSNLDRKYGHFRRYTKHSVIKLVANIENAELIRCQYFNLLGVLGWWFNYVLLKRESLPKNQAWFFDRIVVPLARYLELLFNPPLGLSLVFWIKRN